MHRDCSSAVCKPQADERDVSDEAFGELLVGDTIELAATALVRGIADFFPKDRRAVLDRLWAATRRTRTEAIQMATHKLDSPLVEQAITGAIRKASDEIDQRLPATLTDVRDVCGAGDTVFAALSVSLVMGKSLREACRAAMGAAGRQVALPGVSSVAK